MKKTLLLPLFISLFSVSLIYAQNGKQITHQQLYWLRYYNKLVFSKNYWLDTEIEDRRFTNESRQDQLLLPRVHIRRKLGEGWQAGIGFTYFLQTLPQDAEKSITLVRPELRPQQELQYSQKVNSWLGLSHRYWLEERFIRKTKGNELIDGYNFNFRFRYQLQVEFKIIKKDSPKGELKAKVFDEIFFNFGKKIIYNSFDQNRVGFSFEYGFFNNLSMEAGVFNWFQEQSSGSQYVSRNILRVTIRHTINITKK